MPCAASAGISSFSIPRDEQAVFVLAGDEAREVVGARGPQRVDHLPGRHLAAADVAHLALVHEIVERAQRLLDRRERIDQVILVEIDPVGLEPLQAGLDRGHDIAARAALELALGVHRPAELGDQHDVLAAGPEHLAQDGLGAAAPAVDVAAIEEGDAEIERLVDRRRASLRDRAGGRNCCSRARSPRRAGPTCRRYAGPCRCS